MREVKFRWYKKLRWCFVATALMVATLYASSASAALTIRIQQMTANPALTRSAVNYTVTVQNAGTIVAQQNVQVRVSFPGSAWGIPANGVGANCAFAGGGGAPTALVTCTAGTLAGGATKTIAFQIIAPSRVLNYSSQQFTITAGLDVNGATPGTGGADATATVATDVLALPDLDPQWSGPLTITAGAEAAYTLRVRNTGDGRAGGVFARITLPREVDFVRLEQSTFRSCPRTGQEINCSELLILPGSEASVRVIVRPLQLVANGTKLLLSVGTDPSGTVRENRENNNTAFIMPTVRAEADLKVTGTFSVSDPPYLFPISKDSGLCGANDLYMSARLKIRNNGPGQSRATTLRVDWLGGRAVPRCPEGTCNMGCICGDARNPSDCPPPHFFNTASVPVLAPGTEITINVEAVRDKPGFGQNYVEWGSVTLDPDNLVNDTNRQNNTWVMHP